MLVRLQLERPMYNFKNPFCPDFVYIYSAKHIFSRDMFCLYRFGAKIHGVPGNVAILLVVSVIWNPRDLSVLETAKKLSLNTEWAKRNEVAS